MDTETHTQTIIRALALYRQWMDGLSRTNATVGRLDDAQECAIEAHKAQEALAELGVKA